MLTTIWIVVAALNVWGIAVNVRTFRTGYYTTITIVLAAFQGLMAVAALGGAVVLNVAQP